MNQSIRPATRIALLASSNLELLVAPLEEALAAKSLYASVWAAGFNQYRQVILDLDSQLYSANAEDIILFLDTADLFSELLNNPFDSTVDTASEIAVKAIQDLTALIANIVGKLPAATIYLNTISLDAFNALYGLEYNSRFSLRGVVSTYNLALGKLARQNSSVVIVDVESLAAATGLERWLDQRLWYLGRIRYSGEATLRLAREYANVIAARHGRVKKCLVLDLDNTLWGGIVGEDGMDGIQIGYEGVALAFLEFQRELLNFGRMGILLAICSKNHLADAIEVFRSHPAMILHEEHFSAKKINWKEKSENIAEIAAELNLGLDSLVFVDDNPIERAAVRAALPEVCVPEWPQDPSEYRRALLSLIRTEFLRFNVTEEDQSRKDMYRAQAERRQATSNAADLQAFYRSLDMKLTVGRADNKTIPRIAQLTQKTNQFNLTTRRYTEPEILYLANACNSRAYWMELEDKFGPNGIVGVIIVRERLCGEWVLDTFLMSCRVIGRTVEDAFVKLVASEMLASGAIALTGEFIPTQKNGIVADLYDRLHFTRERESDAGSKTWRLILRDADLRLPDWFEALVVEETVS